MQHAIPLLEFDHSLPALIEPSKILSPLDIPECCVMCFFADVIQHVTVEHRGVRVITKLNSEMGHNPVYELDINGQRVVLVHPGVGAPLAAAYMEELIALGCRKFVACGGAGVLDSDLALGHVVIPNAAVRDEGTSYHYLPPARTVSAPAAVVATLEATLSRRQIPYVVGKTWTTDAIYRETPTKIAARRSEGCLTVEMEAAAFFAVAEFRNVQFGQLLYSGDDLSGDVWDHRGWQTFGSARDRLFWLAAEACLAL
jgi:uridine phosphorylase